MSKVIKSASRLLIGWALALKFFSLESSTLYAAGDVSELKVSDLSVPFAAKSIALDSATTEKLKQQAEIHKGSDATFDIYEESLGLKEKSLDIITARARSLRIVRELSRNGVNPAHIKVIPVAAQGRSEVRIQVRPDSKVEKVKLITPKPADNTDTDDRFVVKFATASAEPADLDDARLKKFLDTVGMPGRDALVIVGSTDATGKVEYNKVLGELRALRVFEILVRSGTPPYRIATRGITSKSDARQQSADQKSAERNVTVYWEKDEEIAAKAKEEDAKIVKEEQTPAPFEQSQAAEPIKAESVSQPQDTGAAVKWTVIPALGIAQPLAEWADFAKAGLRYGLGFGVSGAWDGKGEWRTNALLSRSEHEAKKSDQSGTVETNHFDLRFEYAWGKEAYRPFALLGFGTTSWEGTITETSTQLKNSESRQDFGVLAGLGLDLNPGSNFQLSPELMWRWAGGGFYASLLEAQLTVRFGL